MKSIQTYDVDNGISDFSSDMFSYEKQNVSAGACKFDNAVYIIRFPYMKNIDRKSVISDQDYRAIRKLSSANLASQLIFIDDMRMMKRENMNVLKKRCCIKIYIEDYIIDIYKNKITIEKEDGKIY